MKHPSLFALALGLAALSGGLSIAADQARMQEQSRMQEQIYGSQLMTPQERLEYQAKMRAARNAEERERIRAEHHKQMQERAKERGVTLPDMPPSSGGMGPGYGGGMGPGPGGRGR